MERKIVLYDFFGPGRHVYEDQLGWDDDHRREARSSVSKEIFNHHIVTVGFNMTFYYIDNDTFYGVFTEEEPVAIKILERDRSCPYLNGQVIGDVHDRDCPVVGVFPCEEIWDNLIIDGKHLEEVIERSVLLDFF